MLRNWIKVVWQHTKKHPGYAVINIAGLAIGLAFALLIFLWVRLEFGVDRFHETLDRLYLVAFSCEGGTLAAPRSVPRPSTCDRPTRRSPTPPGGR